MIKDKHIPSRMLALAGGLMTVSGILTALCGSLAIGGIFGQQRPACSSPPIISGLPKTKKKKRRNQKMNKRLYKSNDNRMIDGVCGGIAEYFDIDPTLVRLGWVMFCALGGSGILAYIIAAVVIPRRPEY